MTDQDIDRWSANWREAAPAASDLARMAKRERLLLATWIALDWVVGAGLIAFAAWMWIAIGTPVMRFSAAGIAALTVVALVFTTLNWRGSFAAERSSAADFLAQALGRSRARLRYLRFGWWVLAADLVVIAGAIALEIRDEGMARVQGMLTMAVLATAVAASVLASWSRRERRRMERLAAMQAALRPDGDNDHE